jgi:hypothetical protein
MMTNQACDLFDRLATIEVLANGCDCPVTLRSYRADVLTVMAQAQTKFADSSELVHRWVEVSGFADALLAKINHLIEVHTAAKMEPPSANPVADIHPIFQRLLRPFIQPAETVRRAA